MDIIVKGRHTDVSERFRQHVFEKLTKIEKFDPMVMHVDVEVSKERNSRRADQRERIELTCRSRGPVIRAEACAEDRYAALDLAWAKLEARLRKAAGRRRVHRGARTPMSVASATAAAAMGASGGAAAVSVDGSVPDAAGVGAGGSGAAEKTVEEPRKAGPIDVDGEGPLVVREKTHQASPMTLDQAMYEMELVGHDFFLFIDAHTTQPSVVYRRRGYDYGVIHLAV